MLCRMFNILKNTVEGTTRAALGTAKAGLGVLASPIDSGDLFVDGLADAHDGLKQIGKPDDRSNCKDS